MNASSQIPDVRFTLIADTSDRFSDFAPYVPSVNDAGLVAFQAALQGGGMGVFTGDGGPPATVVETPDSDFAAIDSHPDINNGALVSFYGRLKTGRHGVFLIRDGEPIAIVEEGGAIVGIGPLGPTMNEEGRIAFRADLRDGLAGVFSGSAEGVARIADTGGRFSSFQGLPIINNQGDVAFRGDLQGGGSGIFRSDGGDPCAVVEIGELFHDIAPFPSMNDLGMISFGATLGTGGVGVFSTIDGHSVPVISATTPFESVRSVLINNAGFVALIATPRAGRLGVYVGPDPVADRIIAVGDSFLGSQVGEFALNPVSVNASAQLAIRVRLANDRQVIVRVDRTQGTP